MDSKEQPIDALTIKRLWNHQLEPIKVMLVHRKKDLNKEEWLQFVDVTRNSILRHPDQYLIKHFNSEERLKEVIGKIFEDFLKDMEG